MSSDLLLPHLPTFMAKTLLPVEKSKLQSKSKDKDVTVRTLMSWVYTQVKPMLRGDTDPGKLYLTTKDGFFLPPNASINALIRPEEPICLLSW